MLVAPVVGGKNRTFAKDDVHPSFDLTLTLTLAHTHNLTLTLTLTLAQSKAKQCKAKKKTALPCLALLCSKQSKAM